MGKPIGNPFPYSDTNKRYHTFDYFMRHTLGGKCARIPLDAGLSCPNRDGSCGEDGCLFCAGRSAAAQPGTIEEQYAAARLSLLSKWKVSGYIPYLQAGTNTYGDPDRLRALWERCAALPEARMLALGTRADCLPPEIPPHLRALSHRIPILVELGMQSSSDKTLARIRRGYGHRAFLAGYDALRAAGGNIRVGLHLMLGLPGEGRAEMMATVREAARLRPDTVKLHTVCVLRGTALADAYLAGTYTPLTEDEALSLVAEAITYLPPETVIDRVAGDAPRELLLAPLWSRNKRGFQNRLDALLAERDTVQGACESRTDIPPD